MSTNITKPLTDKQRMVLEFVNRFLNEKGFPPTLREIGDGINLSNISAVRGHVNAILKKGYIQKEADKARSIRIIAEPSILSRFKRQLHEFARTDEGILQDVVYGIVLATRKHRPHFMDAHKNWINDILQKKAVEHGWEFLRKDIEPTYLTLVVKVWPNHSPELVVSRIKQAGNSGRLLRLKEFPGKSLWAKQYAITTKLEELEDIKNMLLETIDTESE